MESSESYWRQLFVGHASLGFAFGQFSVSFGEYTPGHFSPSSSTLANEHRGKLSFNSIQPIPLAGEQFRGARGGLRCCERDSLFHRTFCRTSAEVLSRSSCLAMFIGMNRDLMVKDVEGHTIEEISGKKHRKRSPSFCATLQAGECLLTTGDCSHSSATRRGICGWVKEVITYTKVPPYAHS